MPTLAPGWTGVRAVRRRTILAKFQMIEAPKGKKRKMQMYQAYPDVAIPIKLKSKHRMRITSLAR